MIEGKKLTKSFSQGSKPIHVLKDMDFEISDGEILAILGPSGSGKSTLLSILALLDAPDEGDIIFDGQSTQAWSENQRTRFRGENIGIVFQQYHLVPYLTALENVTLPLIINQNIDSEATREAALALLAQVGLKDRFTHRPSQLSGGESQRVALARALIHQPKLLLADEPSGNLDQSTASSVMNLFFEMVRRTKTTTILVTHDQSLADKCDRRLFLRDGKLCS